MEGDRLSTASRPLALAVYCREAASSARAVISASPTAGATCAATALDYS